MREMKKFLAENFGKSAQIIFAIAVIGPLLAMATGKLERANIIVATIGIVLYAVFIVAGAILLASKGEEYKE